MEKNIFFWFQRQKYIKQTKIQNIQCNKHPNLLIILTPKHWLVDMKVLSKKDRQEDSPRPDVQIAFTDFFILYRTLRSTSRAQIDKKRETVRRSRERGTHSSISQPNQFYYDVNILHLIGSDEFRSSVALLPAQLSLEEQELHHNVQ